MREKLSAKSSTGEATGVHLTGALGEGVYNLSHTYPFPVFLDFAESV